MNGLELVLAALLGYGLGSIPFGLLLTRLSGGGDIRKIGSGNIGATNVLRTGRKELAAATLLLDAGKGAAAVLLARHFGGEGTAMIAGLAAFLGHLYPFWLGFKGGKGVATMIGVLLALAWPLGLAFCAIWLTTALIRRQSSLAGLAAAASAPVLAYFFSTPALALTTLVLAAFLFLKHRENIARLMAGTEPRIGQKENAGS